VGLPGCAAAPSCPGHLVHDRPPSSKAFSKCGQVASQHHFAVVARHQDRLNLAAKAKLPDPEPVVRWEAPTIDSFDAAASIIN